PPGLASYGMDRRPQKVIGIGVCGLKLEAIESIIAMIEDRQRRNRDFAAVFLTDSHRTDIFRRRGFAFEYLPELTEADACKTYAERRITLLEDKWGLAGIIDFGRSAY